MILPIIAVQFSFRYVMGERVWGNDGAEIASEYEEDKWIKAIKQLRYSPVEAIKMWERIYEEKKEEV